ncbi:hypothetical protein ILYODFUR_014367 [Ilyodon furcidens]|uniref:Uncharacterized protein n=1 Tax=Ilyodon furcidens TaxID=33524 RepID=A0ABV0UK27_9TELE
MKGARGGKVKSAPPDKEENIDNENEDGGAVGSTGKEYGQDREPAISDLANVLQAHIGQQNNKFVRYGRRKRLHARIKDSRFSNISLVCFNQRSGPGPLQA